MLRTTIMFPFIVLVVTACSTERPAPVDEAPRSESVPVQPVARQTYRIMQTLPHDQAAFTQGLIVHDGMFLETTGQYGQSSIRRVDIRTGTVKRMERLDDRYFGEGMTVLGGKAYMLTWLTQTGFVYDAKTLKQLSTFTYQGEGWGLTNDGTNLIMSNGTNMLIVLDPTTYRVVRTLHVTIEGRSLSQLNELEWINGEIWANVWRTNEIVRIDPSSGVVKGVIDCTGILPQMEMTEATDVMNGIAYDSTTKALYVTGKNWPHVYQIAVQ